MKTKFTMYAGLRTIGGVIFSVTYGNDRVILEFGSAYDPATAVFDGKVKGRRENWVRDRLKVGLLPKIDGIYRRSDLGNFPLAAAEDSQVRTAVFISHLHLDHMSQMGMLAPEVDVYLHQSAQVIEAALEATGNGVETWGRSYKPFTPYEDIVIGRIRVTPILCRDTSYHDFAFMVTTPDGVIHWTGDFTLHNDHQEKTMKQLELLKEARPDVMLCDCTAFMDGVLEMTVPSRKAEDIKPQRELPEGVMDDMTFYASLFESIKKYPGLCVFNYYEREMDDAGQFMAWAESLHRKCVFEPEAGYIVHKFFDCKPCIYTPDTADYAAKARESWYQELLANCIPVSHEEICANPGGYLLQNTYPNIMELFGLPSENAAYIHADGIPIGAFDPSYGNMRKIVDKTGFAYVGFFNTSYYGHGYPPQVKWFVDQVDPKVLIPCHGYNPERLLPKNGRQLLPELGREYILDNHELYPADILKEEL